MLQWSGSTRFFYQTGLCAQGAKIDFAVRPGLARLFYQNRFLRPGRANQFFDPAWPGFESNAPVRCCWWWVFVLCLVSVPRACPLVVARAGVGGLGHARLSTGRGLGGRGVSCLGQGLGVARNAETVHGNSSLGVQLFATTGSLQPLPTCGALRAAGSLGWVVVVFV